MKAIAPVRQALGVRTVFNILGPLTNPAAPPFHLIGAYSAPTARADGRGAGRACRSSARSSCTAPSGWDEPTPVGPFTLFDVRPGSVHAQSTRSPADYGLARCLPADAGGRRRGRTTRAALRAVLRGEDRGAHRDALLLGAALALESDRPRVADRADGVAARAPRDRRAVGGGALLDAPAAASAREARR